MCPFRIQGGVAYFERGRTMVQTITKEFTYMRRTPGQSIVDPGSKTIINVVNHPCIGCNIVVQERWVFVDIVLIHKSLNMGKIITNPCFYIHTSQFQVLYPVYASIDISEIWNEEKPVPSICLI